MKITAVCVARAIGTRVEVLRKELRLSRAGAGYTRRCGRSLLPGALDSSWDSSSFSGQGEPGPEGRIRFSLIWQRSICTRLFAVRCSEQVSRHQASRNASNWPVSFSRCG